MQIQCCLMNLHSIASVTLVLHAAVTRVLALGPPPHGSVALDVANNGAVHGHGGNVWPEHSRRRVVREHGGAVVLELASNGAIRGLLRRESNGHHKLGNFMEQGQANVNFDPSDGTRTTGNWTEALDNNCNEREKMCCIKGGPKEMYMACLERNCAAMNKPAEVCIEYSMCTKECQLGCCCFWIGFAGRTRRLVSLIQRRLMKVLAMILALQQSSMSSVEDVSPEKPQNVPDPAEAARYTLDVMLDMIKWAFAIPTVSVLVVMLHQRLKNELRSQWQKLKRTERPPRLNAMTSEQMDELERDADKKAREELNEYLSQNELDRLGGGVEKVAITKVSGLSTAMWTLTQAVGVGLYYCIMTEPMTTSICVLGTSGRIMVLLKKPQMTSTSAAKMFIGAGMTIISVTLVFLLYLRALERTVAQAKTSADPRVRESAEKAGIVAKIVNGRVHFFTLGFLLLVWLVEYAILKARIRPWGFDDERNYYESKEACVGQYFRGGTRGAIPGLMRPRRQGGMRLFFGPYPDKAIFDHLGRSFPTLQNLEPMIILPSETDNGYPPSGNGQPASSEDKVGRAQLILGSLNAFLGSLGLCIFGLHMYNFLMNVQNCPLGGAVRPCVEGRDCTQLSKTPWLAHHLQTNNLRTPDQILKDQLLPAVDFSTMGVWLKQTSDKGTRDAVYNISKQACAMRFTELFVDTNATLYSASSDTLGKFNAANFLQTAQSYGYKIRWDPESYHCVDCAHSFFLFYFTNFDNIIEIIEVLLLGVTLYASVNAYALTHRRLQNCPMVDLPFKNDPGSTTDVDIDKIEKLCLNMIGHCFFYRYRFSGLPKHMQALEKDQQKLRMLQDTSKLADPYSFSTDARSWNNYTLTSPTNAREVFINKGLLGILQDEEVISAWSEAPRLTRDQWLAILCGFFFCFVMPAVFACKHKSPVCAIEAVIAELIHYMLVAFFILRRRPQAAFILTSRRILQISRQPAYRDMFGMTEPMVKLDVMIHNSGLSYASMTMEAMVPWHRRLLAMLFRFSVYRRGQITIQGAHGIFKMWRTLGDVRACFHAISKITSMEKIPLIDPGLGQSFLDAERTLRQDKPPDPLCACICCPYSPPPSGVDFKLRLLERYCMRQREEMDVYGRQLVIRPATCLELCCGRGCVCELSCCCCCQLDECLTDFIVTTHRILVEQRSVHRYCRLFFCGKRMPNIRVTYLAHNKAAAYLCQKDASAFGFSKLRQDLKVKLLQSDAREYSAGLMLIQRPYQIYSKNQMPVADKIWLGHITHMLDLMTQRQDVAEEGEEGRDTGRGGGRGGRGDESSRSSGSSVDLEVFFQAEERRETSKGMAARKGDKGKAKGKSKGYDSHKGKGKGEGTGKGKDEGKGKDKGKGKGKDIDDGDDGKGKGPGHTKGKGKDAEEGGDEGKGDGKGTGHTKGKGKGKVTEEGGDEGKGDGKGTGHTKGKGKGKVTEEGGDEGKGDGKGAGHTKGKGKGKVTEEGGDEGKGDGKGAGHTKGKGKVTKGKPSGDYG